MQLTDDRYGDLQPQLSPDGKTIAFATDRGAGVELRLAALPSSGGSRSTTWNGHDHRAPGTGGAEPQSPVGAGRPVDRLRLGPHRHRQCLPVRPRRSPALPAHQRRRVPSAAITEYSPAISWARQADRLAFTYFENGEYTVWSVNNPRGLKAAPVRDIVVASKPWRPRRQRRAYDDHSPTPRARFSIGARRRDPRSANLPLTGDTLAPSVSIAACSTRRTCTARYHPLSRHGYSASLQPDFSARPSIGYIPDALRPSRFRRERRW